MDAMDIQSPADQGNSPVLKIPLEILLRITQHLTTPELGNVRLACRPLEQALHKSFTDEFFTRRQFMVSEMSLAALIAISKSRFSWHLRHVYLGVDRIRPSTYSHSPSSETQQRALQKYLTEQMSLWDVGRVIPLLAEAFKNLENLETVTLRDFNSTRRSRDGHGAQWYSYGARTIMGECNISLHGAPHWDSNSRENYADRLFKVLVHALGTAGAKPQAIEVWERRGYRLADFAFHIPPSTESYVVPLLQNLKRLYLCTEITWISTATSMPTAEFDNVCLYKFLSHCTNLEDLRINDKRNDVDIIRRANLKKLFHWLAGTTIAEEPSSTQVTSTNGSLPGTPTLPLSPPTRRFPRLTNLSLGMLSITQSELLGILAVFAPTLTHLELWRIVIVPEDRSQSNQILDNKINIWGKLFKNMQSIPLNLRHIKAGMLQQNCHDTENGFQYWLKLSYKSQDGQLQGATEYTGTDWRHFVNHEIIPSMRIDWDFQRPRPAWEDGAWIPNQANTDLQSSDETAEDEHGEEE